MSWALCWVVNRMPNFGKTRQPFIPLWRFDPYAARPKKSQMEKDAGFDACWEIASDPVP